MDVLGVFFWSARSVWCIRTTDKEKRLFVITHCSDGELKAWGQLLKLKISKVTSARLMAGGRFRKPDSDTDYIAAALIGFLLIVSFCTHAYTLTLPAFSLYPSHIRWLAQHSCSVLANAFIIHIIWYTGINTCVCADSNSAMVSFLWAARFAGSCSCWSRITLQSLGMQAYHCITDHAHSSQHIQKSRKISATHCQAWLLISWITYPIIFHADNLHLCTISKKTLHDWVRRVSPCNSIF